MKELASASSIGIDIEFFRNRRKSALAKIYATFQLTFINAMRCVWEIKNIKKQCRSSFEEFHERVV